MEYLPAGNDGNCLTLLQVTCHWKRRNRFCVDCGLIRVAKADLARPVIRELHNVVIALLVPAVTVLGSHRATRFRPCVCMTNLGTSFLRLRRLGRGLRQGIIAAVQTLAFGRHGIAPGIVGARFTSRLFFSHIVSLFGSLQRLEAKTSTQQSWKRVLKIDYRSIVNVR